MSNSLINASCLQDISLDISSIFWQQWQQCRDYLYRCCYKWMNCNAADAEDALSRAMLKAWEVAPKYIGKVVNFKAWLKRLTYNLCVDINRRRIRDRNRVEDIELCASLEKVGLVSDNTPEIALETKEKNIVIRRAVENLPPRLRETFILHFCQELSYQEIAQQQQISYQNVCKRISQARTILRLELRGYFIESDGTNTGLPITSNQCANSSKRL